MALLLLVPAQIFGLFWTAPALALCQNLSPVAVRARAAAVRIVAANLVGVSFGPLLTGGLSDWFKAQGLDAATGLRYSLMCGAGLFAWAVVHWLLALRALAKEAKTGAA
jgi:MFS family permease